MIKFKRVAPKTLKKTSSSKIIDLLKENIKKNYNALTYFS